MTPIKTKFATEMNHTDDFPISLVIGFSAGHCGTSTLSDHRTYHDASRLVFYHEKGYIKREHWRRISRKEEEKWVLQTYLPFVRSQVSAEKPIYFDAGHQNLFFIYGLIRAIGNSKQNRTQLTLFPIRREMKEHALSLTYRSENRTTLSDLCRIATGFCPLQRQEDIVSKYKPSRKEWLSNMTTFDQAAWIVKETNQRWYAIRKEFPAPPNIHYIETRSWTSKEPESFKALVDDVAAILGTNRSQVLPHARPHRSAFQRQNETLARRKPVVRPITRSPSGVTINAGAWSLQLLVIFVVVALLLLLMLCGVWCDEEADGLPYM